MARWRARVVLCCAVLWCAVLYSGEAGRFPPRSIDIYVNASAASEGNGDQATPCKTLYCAFNRTNFENELLQTNVTINIAPGTYPEASELPSILALESQDPFSMIVRATDPTSRPVITCSTSLSGTFIDCSDTLGIWTFQDLIFSNCVTYGELIHTWYSTTISNVDIENIECIEGNALIRVVNNPGTIIDISDISVKNTKGIGVIATGEMFSDSETTITDSDFRNNEGFIFALLNQQGSLHVKGTTILGSTNCNYVLDGNDLGVNLTLDTVRVGDSSCSGIGRWDSMTMVSSEVFTNTDVGIECTSADFFLSSYSIWKNGIDVVCDDCNVVGASFCGVNVTQNGTCPNGAQWDRCAVCNGTDACVGCDGVAYSGKTNCSTTSFAVISDTSLQRGVSIDYIGADPDSAIVPTSNNSTSPELTVSVDLLVMNEVTPDGTVIRSQDLSALKYFVVDSITTVGGLSVLQREWRKYYYGTPAYLVITQTLFPNETIAQSGGASFTLDPQSLKISFALYNWIFASSSAGTATAVEFLFNVKGSQSIRSSSRDIETLLSTETDVLQREEFSYTTADTQQGISILNFAVYQPNATAEFNYTKLIGYNQTSYDPITNSQTFSFHIDGPFNSMIYDPDVSVLVSTKDNQDDSSGDDNLGLIIGLSVGIPLAFFVVVVVIVASVVSTLVYRFRWKLLAKPSGGSVDF